MSMLASENPNYRPDIDGLRAVAVGAVIAFHAFPQFFGGGFVGVDIFFVISGYLISGIILSALDRGRFSFKEFYARRIKRIFPALLLVFAASLAIGWFVLIGGEYKLLGRHVAAGGAFVSNFVLWSEAGYFDAAADSKVLLHLWSLGIEEQFYLLWPLSLFLIARTRRLTPIFLSVMLLGSFALNVANVHSDPTGDFYSPLTRFWELFVGALLAWVSLNESSPLRFITSPRWASARSFVGLVLIAAALALVRREKAFPGWWALLPVGGAALLISAGPSTWFNRRVLGNRLLVFIGLISYPLYVWHWPLLVFEPYAESGSYSWQVRIASVFLAVLLAWLTARFVERPIRSAPARPWKVGVPAGLMAASVAVGLFIFKNDGFPARLKDVGEYEAYFDNTPPSFHWIRTHDVARAYRLDCDFYNWETARPRSSIDPSCYTPHSSRTVVLWGDSHAQQFYNGLATTLPSDVSILPLATSACEPSIDPLGPDRTGYCRMANAFARDRIQELKPDMVILAQARRHERYDYEGIVDWLRGVGVKHVVLIGPVPHWHPYLNQVVARNYLPNVPPRLSTHLMQQVFDTDRLMKARMAGRPVTYISILDGLCNEEGCMTYLDGDPRGGLMTADAAHLTPKASAYVGEHILAPVLRKLL